MTNTGIISLVLIVANIIFSYKGLKNHSFFDRYSFEVERILLYKEYKRLITSGFLHVSWRHLIFNMISLFAFSLTLETDLGSARYLIIYFGSLIGGNLLSLFIHRRHSDYSAVGASGAVCGVIFASIALYPGMALSFFGLFPIAGWLYGILFVLCAVYGIKSARDNIGHDAHLGGALAGLITAIIMVPDVLVYNYITIIAIAVPCIFFIYMIITRPHFLLIDNYFFKRHQVFVDIDDKYNYERANREKEMDAILDKIHKKGMNSLTKSEKEKLDRYSQQIN
ncbi:membrane associated rhomboid family serine protease [Chitinophaga niastensis]|uniref:Membrane associated rhomboid family serine protease n=1 Tax=Chitinophaga niastensis TaxID=536980 RepID=A0A2P8HVX8_CHINA|nr:rhomboid family intramembrane serine protease [Chitinophaga niastensis]PSL50324.1 membrane associated rhomboid family serine protease [Chitinophaga niastensis]